MPVVSIDFVPAPRWRKPTVDDRTHGKPPVAKPKGNWLLFATVARIALDPNRHALRIPPGPALSRNRSFDSTPVPLL